MDVIPTDGWTVLEARVDYWAGTTPDPEIGRWAYERGREYIESDCLGSLATRGSSEQGYIGVMSQHTFAGQRDDGTYVRLSSLDASGRWIDFISNGLRTSRIDVCVTSTTGRDIPFVAYAIRYGDRLPRRKRGAAPRVDFYSSEGLGDTCYVGSPRSVRRGRIYDKARESKGHYPVGAWRWEVQSRHDAGKHLGEHLASRESPEEWIAAYVRGWFNDNGIPAPWSINGDGKLPKLPAEVTTDARRLAWLKSSVAPMVERLQARYSMHELRSALGLLYNPAERTRTRLSRDTLA